MNKTRLLFLVPLYLLAGLFAYNSYATDTVEVAASGELPRYGTCNYLPDPPDTWSGMELVKFGKIDEKLGTELSYHGATGLWDKSKEIHYELENTISFYRFNMGYDNINEAIANEEFVMAMNAIISFINKYQLHDKNLEWDSLRVVPEKSMQELGFVATRAAIFTGVDGGVTVDEFVSLGYTEKCMTKMRITKYVEDPDSPYRYIDYFFQLDKLNKYYEKKPIVTTLNDGNETYTGETFGGVPYGQGTYTWSNGKKYVGGWKDGKRDGQGTWTHPDGRKYVGEYKDDKRNGQGTLSGGLKGLKYDGEFKDGNPWNGTEYNKNGNIIAVYTNGKRQKPTGTTPSKKKNEEKNDGSDRD